MTDFRWLECFILVGTKDTKFTHYPTNFENCSFGLGRIYQLQGQNTLMLFPNPANKKYKFSTIHLF